MDDLTQAVSESGLTCFVVTRLRSRTVYLSVILEVCFHLRSNG